MTGLSDDVLRLSYKQIPWDKPMPVTVIGGDGKERFVCRYCVAQKGLRAADVPVSGMTHAGCLDHIAQEHPK